MMAKVEFNLYAIDTYVGLPLTSDPNGERLLEYVFTFMGGRADDPRWVDTPAKRAFLREQSFLDPMDPDPAKRPDPEYPRWPGPRLDVTQCDDVFINLINLGLDKGFNFPDPTNLKIRERVRYTPSNPSFEVITDVHTVHIHGGHGATQVDGVPELSFGVPLGDFTPGQPLPPGGKATYYWKPEAPGTYFYHCHQEASEHVHMGMWGALIVYPELGRHFAYNDRRTHFDHEYVLMVSDFDQKWHDTVATRGTFYAPFFKPDFWLVNGRAFPDTLFPTKLPRESPGYTIPKGYDSYVHVNAGETFLLRIINIGYQVVPWHIHGWHFTVIGKDTNLRLPMDYHDPGYNMEMMNHEGEMGFTATIGSGESWDLLLTADDKSRIYREYIQRGLYEFPSLNSQVDRIGGYVNIPLAGTWGPKVGGSFDFDYWNYGTHTNLFYPQWYVMHNHDDYKVTNGDLYNPGGPTSTYPGGQLCFIQTDRPIRYC